MDTWEDLGIDGKSGTKKKGKHDKPKPWDDDPNIDRWNIEKFDPSWNESGMLEVTSFSTLFPTYREKYLQEAWPAVKQALNVYGVSCELDLVRGSMTVSTTRKTRDPYIIVKSREVIKLLSRSVPVSQAIKVLDDGMESDIIKIGNLVHKKERLFRRRDRLVGPNSSTLKALEIVTRCYILVQGNTVAAMGSFKGLKQVRNVVEDCMLNKLHPVYNIKKLMMMNELTKDPTLVNENWDRFLPKFRRNNISLKKSKATVKKPYTPFPPPAPPRKIDLEMESGEYFLSQEKKNANRWREKQEKQAAKVAENKQKRDDAFVPPQEEVARKSHQDDTATNIALSVKRKSKELKKQKRIEAVDATAYIGVSEKPSSVKRASKKSK